MQIKIVNQYVDDQDLNPTITFTLKLSMIPKNELPIFVGGKLNVCGKTIAQLQAFDNTGGYVNELYLAQVDENERKSNNTEKFCTHSLQLKAILSRKSIEYIDDVRNNQFNENLAYTLHTSFHVLSTNLKLMPSNAIADFRNSSLLTQKCMNESVSHTIPMSDWVNLFSPKLGVGSFFLVELPVLNAKLQVDQEIRDVYSMMVENIAIMKKYLHQGEWTSVVREGRLIFEHLNFTKLANTKTIIREKLRQLFLDEGHSEKGFEEFVSANLSLFNYASKFHHSYTTNGQLQSPPTAMKEDAYLVFTMALNVINILSRKLERSLSINS